MIAGLLSGFTMYRCGWVFFYHKCVGNSSIHSSGHNDIIIITRFTTQHNNIKGTSIEHDPSLIMMMM